MHCAVIVLAWNGEKYLPACLDALIAQNDVQAELIVVDNASTDTSREIVQRYAPQVRLIANPENLGFSGGNNVGLAATNAEVVVLLNQDTEVRQGWLSAIKDAFLLDEQIGIVGCKALYSDGRIQHAGAKVDPVMAFATHIGQDEVDCGQYEVLTDMEYVTGAAFAIHRKVLEQIGGLDEGFNPALYEEVDYCFRARRLGYRVVYQPQAALIHHESTTLPKHRYELYALLHRNRIRFILLHWATQQWPHWLQAEHVAVTEAAISLEDVLARSQAYVESAVAWPSLCSRRQHDEQLGGVVSRPQAEAIHSHLLSLWKSARQRALLLVKPKPLILSNAGVEGTSDFVASAEHQAESMGAFWEPDIRSSNRLFGRFVDWFRQRWLNTFVRPYATPIFQRQALINQNLIQQQARFQMFSEGVFQALEVETEVVIKALAHKSFGASYNPNQQQELGAVVDAPQLQ